MTGKEKEKKFSLIVCTYSRPASVIRLMDSVKEQSIYPFEILIIDASEDRETERELEKRSYSSLVYYNVDESHTGLTRQRNYGVRKAHPSTEIICFLDDDIVLEPDYFKSLIETYKLKPDALAVGGAINEEILWKRIKKDYEASYDEFIFDGYVRKLGSRNVLRKRLGLLSDKPPGFMPEFSHGFSTGFLPPSGKIYPVEFFMGGVSSYQRSLLQKIYFSAYFEGYGLYEDMDFCLKASKFGKLYVNTGARVFHLHHQSGRPDYFKYGNMVIRNGWYVWRLKHPSPGIKAKFKWTAINVVLASIRLINGLKNRAALADAGGRFYALASIILHKPVRLKN